MSSAWTGPAVAQFDERLHDLLSCLDAASTTGELVGAEMLEDLERIRSAANDLKQRVGRLSAGPPPSDWSRVRHDLRTPLNHILGYGEMLQQDAEEDGLTRAAEHLAQVVLIGRRILKHIDEMVAMARDTPRPAIARSRPPSAAQAGRILVVDDDPGNRELLRRRLEPLGHQVTTAASGADALECLAQQPCDVMLLDLVMPDQDGLAVLTGLRSDPRWKNLPVVMLSGMDELKDVVRSIELGADDYLTKPFDSVLLNARIGASLEKKRLRDREQQHLTQIRQEKKRGDDLLRVLFPEPVVDELLDTGRVVPRRFDDVSVMFADLVGFTAYSDKRQPEEVVTALQDLVQSWEDRCHEHGLQKIKTIGDSIMVVGNLHQPLENPVAASVACGLQLIEDAAKMGHGWGVRIGIHVGPVVAGVLGQERYQYDLWGDTVNTASRVESHGSDGKVTLSAAAWDRIDGIDGATARTIGSVRMKGKGTVELFQVESMPPMVAGD